MGVILLSLNMCESSQSVGQQYIHKTALKNAFHEVREGQTLS